MQEKKDMQEFAERRIIKYGRMKSANYTRPSQNNLIEIPPPTPHEPNSMELCKQKHINPQLTA